MALDSALRTKIETLIASNDVVLFMKGTRHQPECGFSATVVQILDTLIDDYETVNILADMQLREGIKEYASWPTIPQLYIKKNFVGGCDIVREMYRSGELHKMLGVTPPVVNDITVQDLKKKIDDGEELMLLDVRSKEEWLVAHIDGAELLADFDGATLGRLDRDALLVFQCHHGGRSRRVAEQFMMRGFRNVRNLKGGIHAWATEVDPSVPTY